MTLDSFVADAATGILLPASARRQVIPYGDLQVLNWPESQPQVSNSLLPTLAIGVAQGKDAPHLLLADALGALVVNSHSMSLAKFTAPFTGGGNMPQVDDTSGFYPGQVIGMVSQTGSGAACGGATLLRVVDSTHLLLTGSCGGQNFVPGDFIIGKGSTFIDTTGTIFPPNGTNVDVVPGGAQPFTNGLLATSTIYKHLRLAVDTVRSVDFAVQVINATPGVASTGILASGVGFRHVVKDVLWTVDNRSAAAIITSLRIWDGASGVGNPSWFTTMNVAAGTVEKLAIHDLLWKGSDNTQTILDFSNNAANVNQSIYASFYLEA